MSEQTSQIQQMKPYLIIASVLFVLMVAILFWPSNDANESSTSNNTIEPVPAPTTEIQPEQEEGITDMVEPDVFQAPPVPSPVEITSNMEVEEFVAVEVPVEVEIDTSDATIKSALMSIASSELLGQILVNDRLLEKFVINVHNLANEDMSPKDSLVTPPSGKFNTFEQADRQWIDNASFQRYNIYVEILESFDTEELISVFETYQPRIKEKFSEISRPNQSFDQALLDAINLLLDTPQVPVPIEVYSESVVYKFKDQRLESLAGPQKQLLRTGPENMRKIKDVLRDLKEALLDRN